MDGLVFLYKTAFKNRMIRALHKPVTYIYLVLGIAYCVIIIKSFGSFAKMLQYDNPEGVVILLSGITLFFMPSTYINYAKRKGILFKPADVHLVFTSPVNPKLVLLFAYLKQYILGLLMTSVICVMGVVFFHIPPVIMLAYFMLSFVVENILESSLIVLLYGNETLTQTKIKFFSRLIWGIMAAFFLFGVYLFITQEQSWRIIPLFLSNPVVQCIPIIGWNIAFIRLLMLGPTIVNVICTILYCLSALVLLYFALKMRCTGGYFEDAMKFADDYQELMQKKKKGDMSGLRQKQKFRTAKINYKGSYAKAIFYRQLLEYKKNKYFIFGLNTMFCLIGGMFIAILYMKGSFHDSIMKYYIVPCAAAYFTFIFSGHVTKWNKEMENPYTYLLPDSPIKKLWYATLMEHVRATADGCLLVIPSVLIMKFSPLMAVFYLLIYVCLQANKLYLNILAEVLLGDVLGNTGKQIFRMLVMGFLVGIGVLFALIGTYVVNMEMGFVILIAYVIVATLAVAVGGSMAFYKMEVTN